MACHEHLHPRLPLPLLLVGCALAIAAAMLLLGSGIGGDEAALPEPSPGMSRAEWQEAGLLYLADQRNGQVQVFRLRGDLPVPVATLAPGPRRSIRALGLDGAAERLWVLDVAGLSLYDARSQVLLGHWPAPAGVAFQSLVAGKSSFQPLAVLAVDGAEYRLGAADLLAGSRPVWQVRRAS
jgi:hypothetical protein